MDRHTPAVTQPRQLIDRPHHLRLATVDSAPDYDEFVASVLRDEEEERALAVVEDELTLLDRQLMRSGLPVADLAGDALPEVAAPERDTQEVVMDIRVAQLLRFLSELPPLQSKVVRLYWGVGGSGSHSQAEVAEHVGVSQTSVSRLLADGMAELCRRFGVPPDLAA